MATRGTITFVPSVHFSPTHNRRVREVIRETAPDLVAVELDERRYERLERNRRPDPVDLAQELPAPTAAMYRTLKAIQRSIVRLYGLDPGRTDMETAIETAAELDTDVALIDESIEDILDAIAARMEPGTLQKVLLRAQLMGFKEWVDQFALWTLPMHRIESGDDVQPAIDQLRRLLPEVTEVLIDQRDWAMAHRLHRLRCEGYDVVAVIGAGHHNGIQDALDELEEQAATPDIVVPLRSPSQDATTIPIN
jgi:pheromone shutdown protein TraB